MSKFLLRVFRPVHTHRFIDYGSPQAGST